MERDQQVIQYAPEKNFSGDFWERKEPEYSVVNRYDEVIHELDAIFDRIHGGREARYYRIQ